MCIHIFGTMCVCTYVYMCVCVNENGSNMMLLHSTWDILKEGKAVPSLPSFPQRQDKTILQQARDTTEQRFSKCKTRTDSCIAWELIRCANSSGPASNLSNSKLWGGGLSKPSRGRRCTPTFQNHWYKHLQDPSVSFRLELHSSGSWGPRQEVRNESQRTSNIEKLIQIRTT